MRNLKSTGFATMSELNEIQNEQRRTTVVRNEDGEEEEAKEEAKEEEEMRRRKRKGRRRRRGLVYAFWWTVLDDRPININCIPSTPHPHLHRLTPSGARAGGILASIPSCDQTIDQ